MDGIGRHTARQRRREGRAGEEREQADIRWVFCSSGRFAGEAPLNQVESLSHV
jgi:hypothetical protein